MHNRFDPDDTDAYLAWRANKLRFYPRSVAELRVEVARLDAPTELEVRQIRHRIAKTNMALIRCGDPSQVTKSALLRFGLPLGLKRLDNNLCADERAVSTLTVRTNGRASGYVPYTNRPLSWHTDGYYNSPDRQVRAWMLFCVRDALTGGENALLDHEVAYIRLRDQDAGLVRALMDPESMTIPPNLENGREVRPAHTGPVFSVHEGRLHMRYSARSRNVQWKQTSQIRDARDALARLFSRGDVHMFRHKLAPGEGYISNNVLHNRAGFEENAEAGHPGRMLLRTRYLESVGGHPGTTMRVDREQP
jgi:hypothetical protein